VRSINDILVAELVEALNAPVGAVKHPKRVLIVDDSPAFSNMMKEALTGMGCSVDSVGESSKAVESIQAAIPYSRVFLDLHFPGQPSGIAALRKIRELMPDVPITIVSGFLDHRLDSLAKEFNVSLFAKGSSMDELKKIVGA